MEKFYVVKLSKSLLERLLAQVNLFGFYRFVLSFSSSNFKVVECQGNCVRFDKSDKIKSERSVWFGSARSYLVDLYQTQ